MSAASRLLTVGVSLEASVVSADHLPPQPSCRRRGVVVAGLLVPDYPDYIECIGPHRVIRFVVWYEPAPGALTAKKTASERFRNQKRRPMGRRFVSGQVYAATLRRATPTSPSKPEPNSHAAAGIGTAEVGTGVIEKDKGVQEPDMYLLLSSLP